MAKKKEFVKHKVIKERSYNVYGIDGLNLNLLTTITSESRPREVDLCKEFKVKKVIVQEVENSAKYVEYAMPVEEFIKKATVLE